MFFINPLDADDRISRPITEKNASTAGLTMKKMSAVNVLKRPG